MTTSSEMSLATITMFVIYDRPHDHPIGFVVRAWKVARGIVAPPALLGCDIAELSQARALIPSGSRCIGRAPEDDPKIVEVWV